MKYTIIVPAYNEEKRLPPMLDDYCQFFSRFSPKDLEFLVVLNGCVDDTKGVVKRYAKKYKQIRWVDIGNVGSKGAAIVEGFKLAKGNYIGFADADGATKAKYFYDLMLRMGGVDGIIASRYLKGSIVEPKQSLMRRVASRGFNMLVRLLFGMHYYDTQCGCKLFTKKATTTIVPHMGISRWAFDVDLLYQMKRHHLKVKEIPTVWRDVETDNLNVKLASIQMFFAIIRLRLMYSPFKFMVGIFNKVADMFGLRF